MTVVRTILEKCSILHLLKPGKLTAQGCTGSFSLKNTIANLVTSTNNAESGIWLEGSIFLIPEENYTYLMGILMNVFSPMPNSRRLEWQHNQTNVKLTITIYVLRKKIWLGEL